MKRKLIIITLIILGISMLSGGVLVIAGFFGGTGNIDKGLVAHWKMDDIGVLSIQQDLLGHWKFNGDATDSSSHGNDATLFNSAAVTATDRKGQANSAVVIVSATDDYVEAPDSANWAFGTSDFSITGWVKWTGDSGIELGGQLQDANNRWEWGYFSASNIWQFLLTTSGSTVIQVQPTTTFIPTLSQWYHIALTRKSENFTMYIDSTFENSIFDAGSIPNLSAALRIVAQGEGFNGNVDDFRIYSRALTQFEITELYNSYFPNPGVAEDSTPNNNDGELVGATLTTDRKGQTNKAYSFSSSGSNYIGVTSPTAIPIANETYTISAWIKPTVCGNKGIVGWGNFGGGNQVTAFRLIDSSGCKLRTYWWSNDFSSTGNVTLNEWNHVVTLYNGTTRIAYINGVEAGSDTPGVSHNVPDSSNFRIGSTNSAEYFDGIIDDLRIYNRALSATEITSLYDSYNPGTAISSLQKGLVGHWKVDGTGEDATPASNDGNVSGASVTTDRKGLSNKAYSFDGVNDSIDMGDVLDFERTDPFTIGAWIKTNGAQNNRFIVAKQNITTPFRGYSIELVSSKLRFNLTNHNSPANRILAQSTTTIDSGTWRHVAVTYDGSSDISGVTLYIDGVADSLFSSENSLSATTVSSNLLSIGSSISTGGFFLGSVDDVRIYDRVLSTTEITRLYDSYNPGTSISSLQKGLIGYWKMDGIGSPSFGSGLVGYWKFNGDTNDATTNGNNATNFGADLTTDRKGQSNKAYNFVVGNTDYMEIPDSSNWDFGDDDYAISLWINKTTNITQQILMQAVSGSTANYLNLVTYSNGNEILWSAVKDSASVASIDATGISGFGTGVWHHIVATRRGSSVYLYLNGTLLGQDNTISTHPNVAAVLTLGRRVTGGSPDRYFNGKIDDVRIYNRGLSATEITEIYNSYDDISEDYTPYSNDGIVIGATLTTDRKGQSNKAYDFDVAADEIEIADTDLFTFGDGSNDSPFSISLWANFDTVVSAEIFITKGTRSPGNVAEEWGFMVRSDTGIHFRMRDDSNSKYATRRGVIVPSTGTWYYIVMTYDGSGGASAADGINLYLDASLNNGTATTDVGYVSMENDTAVVHIGSSDDNNESFKGQLDDVRIYNRVLSQAEITRLYESYF